MGWLGEGRALKVGFAWDVEFEAEVAEGVLGVEGRGVLAARVHGMGHTPCS